MKRKGADGVGDYDDTFSPVSASSSFRTILSLATQLDMFTFMSTFLRPLYKVNCYPGTVTRKRLYFISTGL